MLGLIAAYTRNRVIGNRGRIPWHIPGEQTRFRQLTTGQTVVMGRRTYEEIGHPLPGRTIFVLSGTKNFDACDPETGGIVKTLSSLSEALASAETEHTYIAGGAALYREALPLCQVLYITEIELTLPGDTFFPDFPEDDFVRTIAARHEGTIPYTYVTYLRKKDRI